MNISGFHQVRQAIVRVLESRIKKELEIIEDEESLERGSLSRDQRGPNSTSLLPATIISHEKRVEIHSFPAICVVGNNVISSTKSQIVEYQHPALTGSEPEEDGVIYRRLYGVVLTAFPISQDEELLSIAQDLFEKAIFRALWKHLQIAENAAIVENSYQCQYLGLFQQNDSLLSEFRPQFQVAVDELVATPVNGFVSTIDNKVSHLGWKTELGGS